MTNLPETSHAQRAGEFPTAAGTNGHEQSDLKQQKFSLLYRVLEVRGLKWVGRAGSFWRLQGECFLVFSRF